MPLTHSPSALVGSWSQEWAQLNKSVLFDKSTWSRTPHASSSSNTSAPTEATMAKVTKLLVILLSALLKEAATANVTKETKKTFTFPLPIISQLTPQYWFLCLALAVLERRRCHCTDTGCCCFKLACRDPTAAAAAYAAEARCWKSICAHQNHT